MTCSGGRSRPPTPTQAPQRAATTTWTQLRWVHRRRGQDRLLDLRRRRAASSRVQHHRRRRHLQLDEVAAFDSGRRHDARRRRSPSASPRPPPPTPAARRPGLHRDDQQLRRGLPAHLDHLQDPGRRRHRRARRHRRPVLHLGDTYSAADGAPQTATYRARPGRCPPRPSDTATTTSAPPPASGARPRRAAGISDYVKEAFYAPDYRPVRDRPGHLLPARDGPGS